MFYTINHRFPFIFFNFTRDKRANMRHFWQKQLRREDVPLLFFEQIVSFSAIIYLNTNSLELFGENSSLNLSNLIERVMLG